MTDELEGDGGCGVDPIGSGDDSIGGMFEYELSVVEELKVQSQSWSARNTPAYPRAAAVSSASFKTQPSLFR